MKRFLCSAAALATLAWAGAGMLAWAAVARRAASLDPTPEHATSQRASQQDGEVAEELSALRQDVRALATALGEGLRGLDDALARRDERSAAEVYRSIESLRGELERAASGPLPGAFEPRDPALAAAEVAPAAPADPSATPAAAESAATADVERAPAAQGGRRASFLAFELPSDDLRFDERRAWSVLPALSRVGFDAKTTLHDFSGVTSQLEGELEVDLAHPADAPRLAVRVEAGALATGEPARDEAMREHLATSEHPLLEFELGEFAPASVEPPQRRGSGTARGRMTIRGVARDVAMEVRYSLDDARRLCVEGEMPLDLEDFGVPVPSKLGLITMQSEVRVWISLRLRAKPRTGS